MRPPAPPYVLLRRPESPLLPTDWRDMELRVGAGGGSLAPCDAVDTRREDGSPTGPIDWRTGGLLAPIEMRPEAPPSTVERALSCEDEMGPSVVRLMLLVVRLARERRRGERERAGMGSRDPTPQESKRRRHWPTREPQRALSLDGLSLSGSDDAIVMHTRSDQSDGDGDERPVWSDDQPSDWAAAEDGDAAIQAQARKPRVR
ncbi:hypothetical protein ATCC90586_011034 [Pythium insidiosum]|nr:hypothetical protein ATCC90586_011034 [Pythium insidiosum]